MPAEAQGIDGRYVLQSIDGKPLPWIAVAIPGVRDTIRLVADTLTLCPDGSFSIKSVWTGEWIPGTTTMSPQKGRWSAEGAKVSLVDLLPAAPTEWLRGPLGARGLSLTHNAGQVLLYQRVP